MKPVADSWDGGGVGEFGGAGKASIRFESSIEDARSASERTVGILG